eukprot:6980868-Prymnesium_polylepis.1
MPQGRTPPQSATSSTHAPAISSPQPAQTSDIHNARAVLTNRPTATDVGSAASLHAVHASLHAMRRYFRDQPPYVGEPVRVRRRQLPTDHLHVSGQAALAVRAPRQICAPCVSLFLQDTPVNGEHSATAESFKSPPDTLDTDAAEAPVPLEVGEPRVCSQTRPHANILNLLPQPASLPPPGAPPMSTCPQPPSPLASTGSSKSAPPHLGACRPCTSSTLHHYCTTSFAQSKSLVYPCSPSTPIFCTSPPSHSHT